MFQSILFFFFYFLLFTTTTIHYTLHLYYICHIIVLFSLKLSEKTPFFLFLLVYSNITYILLYEKVFIAIVVFYYIKNCFPFFLKKKDQHHY